MKVATGNLAPGGMIWLIASFIVVMALFFVWPKSSSGPDKSYTPDGTAVQSDANSPRTNQFDIKSGIESKSASKNQSL